MKSLNQKSQAKNYITFTKMYMIEKFRKDGVKHRIWVFGIRW